MLSIKGSQILTGRHLVQESIDASNIPKSDRLIWCSPKKSGEALLALASLGFEACSGHALDDQELLESLGLPCDWQFEKAAARRVLLKGIIRNDPEFGGYFIESLLYSWLSLAHHLVRYMFDFRGKKLPRASTPI